MKNPEISEDKIETLYHNKYLKLYGMHWDNGAFYLQASRREKEDLTVLKKEEDYKEMVADAVTIALVIRTPGEEPRIYMEHEFRYPTGQFLLSPPAGLIDPADKETGSPLIAAAKREIREETGIEVKDSDTVYVVSDLFFSSPGMTDESNGIVCAVVDLPDLSCATDAFSESTECFDGYSLYTVSEAKELVKKCRDENGKFMSVFTWAILLFFITNF